MMLEQLFLKLLENSIQASFFILAVLFIRFCFKRLPKRYLCLLWGLVALRLIFPVQITSSFSLVPDTSRVQTWAETEITLQPTAPENPESTLQQNMTEYDDVANDTQTTPSGADTLPENTVGADATQQSHTGLNIVPQNSAATDTAQQNQTGFAAPENSGTADDTPATLNLPLLLSLIWCAGMSILLGYGIISYIRTKHFLREAVHDTDNIWYCDRIPSPFVMGYVKPRIYIPFSIEKEQLPYIIAHEKSHIAHFDHLGKLLGYVLLCVYWFNPFIWAAYFSYCKDLELACDERVILELGDSERKPYSQALLTCSVTNKTLLQSPLAFSEVAIKERILNILNHKKLGFWGIVLAVFACIIAVVCFLTSPKISAEEQNLRKAKAFVSQLTPEALATVTQEFNRTHVEYNDADPYSLEGLYLLDENTATGVSLYGFSNYSAMILKDGDTIYPIYQKWLDPITETPCIFKGDYDKDGSTEYALTTLANYGTGMKIYHLTILEVEKEALVAYELEQSLLDAHLDTITYEYLPDSHEISIHTGQTNVLLDVSKLETIYDTTCEILVLGNYISFEEHDGTWWMISRAGVVPKGGFANDSCGAVFSAPVIYDENHSFKLGSFTVETVNEFSDENILTAYADQLENFPGKCSVDENGNLVVSVSTTDYECAVTTSSITGETVYYWSTTTQYTPTAKNYPLEIVNGKVQEVPARIITEEEILEYAFGESLIETTYHAHPNGSKQYILRENGTVHVNVAYEDETFLNLQYLTFEISEDAQTATLTDYGFGYYLLHVNDVSGLNAFRETFTGDGHMIPADSTQLPWEWLVTLNGEVYDRPQINIADVPKIERPYDYEKFATYNIYDWFHDFRVSAKPLNGVFYSEFRYQDETDEVVLLTNTYDEVVSISFNGIEKELPDEPLRIYYGTGGSHGIPYYVDVTGDGEKELIFCDGYRDYGNSYVYLTDSMELLTFDTNIEEITSKIYVEYQKADTAENYLYCRIHYDTQSIEDKTYCNFNNENFVALLGDKDTLTLASEYFTYTPQKEATYIYFDETKNCFTADIWLYIDNTYEFIFGHLYVDYVWDADANQFVVDLDTVSLSTY